MNLFITVGSTYFDELIEILSSDESYKLLESAGFKHVTFQIGKGTVIPAESNKMKIEWYRYKDSLNEDIKKASVIIGHAGAGTILETLFAGKPLIVVLNEKLMDNHQGELAEKLASEGYLRYTSCSKLLNTIQDSIVDDFVEANFKPQRDVFYEALEHILSLK